MICIWNLILQSSKTFFLLFWRKFVLFGQNDNEWEFIFDQVVDHLQVIFCWRMTHINQLEHQLDAAACFEIAADQVAPFCFAVFRNFCIAVAWQVSETHILQTEEVDGLGLTRNGRNTSQVLAVEEFIDERGFTYVGTSGKYQLYHVTLRQLINAAEGGFKYNVIVIHMSPIPFP